MKKELEDKLTNVIAWAERNNMTPKTSLVINGIDFGRRLELTKSFLKGLTKGEETMKTENVDPMNTEQLKTALTP